MRKFPDPLKKFITTSWLNINRHTVNGAHPVRDRRSRCYFERGTEIRMTRDEFAEWCRLNWSTVVEYRNAGIKPSIDRIDNEGHYEIANIRIISLAENCAQGGINRRKRLTEKLNSMKRKCMNCGEILTRKIRCGGQAESAVQFMQRIYCGRSCSISHRNKTNYARWKNHEST